MTGCAQAGGLGCALRHEPAAGHAKLDWTWEQAQVVGADGETGWAWGWNSGPAEIETGLRATIEAG